MKTYAVMKGFGSEDLFRLTNCPMLAAEALLEAGPGYRIRTLRG